MLFAAAGAILAILIIGLIAYNGVMQAKQHRLHQMRDEAMHYLNRIRKYHDLIDSVPSCYMPQEALSALYADMIKLAEVAKVKVPTDPTVKRISGELRDEKSKIDSGNFKRDSKRCQSLTESETVHTMLKRLLTIMQIQAREGMIPPSKFQEIHKGIERNFLQASMDGEMSLVSVYESSEKYQSAHYHASRVRDMLLKHSTDNAFAEDLNHIKQQIARYEKLMADAGESPHHSANDKKASKEWDDFLENE